MKKYFYKTALRIAAEQAYKNEVVDTDMESNIIGEDGYYSTREQWLNERMQEWLEQAEEIRSRWKKGVYTKDN